MFCRNWCRRPGWDIIELGCGSAKLARTLLECHPGSRITDLEVDERQHAKDIAAPQQRSDIRHRRGPGHCLFRCELRSGALAVTSPGRSGPCVPVFFTSFADLEQRMTRSTFADHRIDDAKLAAVRAAFEPHIGSDGARFTRPMHVRLLRHLA